MVELTHCNEQSRAYMVDVTDKARTHRTAVVAGEIHVSTETMCHLPAPDGHQHPLFPVG